MLRLRGSLSVSVAVALTAWMAAAAAAPATASAASQAKCGTAWTVVKSPDHGSDGSVLYKVGGVAANDEWAVGLSRTASGTHTLAEHFDGSSWSIVPSPNRGGSSFLFGLSARTSTDVWAVGGETAGDGLHKNLIEHWDGTAWSVVASPSVKSTNGNLAGVVALSANDAYAVGNNGQAQLLHWDGVTWSRMNAPRPKAATASGLVGASADSSGNVWLVGNSSSATSTTPLIAQGSGGSFGISASPALGGSYGNLGATSAGSTDDVWAVGQFAPTSGPARTLAEHNDGSGWSVVAAPSPGVGDDELAAVHAVSATDVWATGYTNNGSYWRTLIEQWNGANWTIVASPSPGGANDVLWGATTIGTTGWAVGSTTPAPGAPTDTLIERACGI